MEAIPLNCGNFETMTTLRAIITRNPAPEDSHLLTWEVAWSFSTRKVNTNYGSLFQAHHPAITFQISSLNIAYEFFRYVEPLSGRCLGSGTLLTLVLDTP
jgi:hypothetical protein